MAPADIATLFNEVQAEIEGQHQQLAVLDHEIGAIEQAVRSGAAVAAQAEAHKHSAQAAFMAANSELTALRLRAAEEKAEAAALWEEVQAVQRECADLASQEEALEELARSTTARRKAHNERRAGVERRWDVEKKLIQAECAAEASRLRALDNPPAPRAFAAAPPPALLAPSSETSQGEATAEEVDAMEVDALVSGAALPAESRGGGSQPEEQPAASPRQASQPAPLVAEAPRPHRPEPQPSAPFRPAPPPNAPSRPAPPPPSDPQPPPNAGPSGALSLRSLIINLLRLCGRADTAAIHAHCASRSSECSMLQLVRCLDELIAEFLIYRDGTHGFRLL
mmetsp:Transcript_40617/g.133828  ORF Transcript_40617/g.133828 Transcript_40617/m.133828 type:complete len:338 (+) Transcript_40617:37-1050(+)